MKIVDELTKLKTKVKAWKQAGLTVGFVPTMGNLHAGHLSLVTIAQQCCDKVVVSIFVNPTQFAPDEDLDNYPRTLDVDYEQLANLNVDIVFVPSVAQMYSSGLQQTVVSVPKVLTGILEGASRPGHFDGVTTVVCKLFNMVKPDVVIFGQKDYQQLRVIEKMVADLALDVEVVSAPIIRDVDGLALSSRNQYLSKKARKIAPKLYVTLKNIALAIGSGNTNINELTKTATKQLITEGFDKVDYLQVCNSVTLQPLNDNSQNSQKAVILVVARLDNTRLLDNLEVTLTL